MTEKHPKGLFLLFFVEMWERFSFYGMRALLVLYMVKQLMFGTLKAGHVYGYYLGIVYMTPLIGGYLADRYIGARKSIVIGGVLMALGHFAMAIPTLPFFYTALALIIIGNGFFKPNISVMVGQLYGKNDPRRDGGFTIFYMGINVGALLAPLVCGYLGEKVGWHYGFAAAGVGMLAGLGLYLWGQKRYLGNIGMEPCRPKVKSHETCANEPLTKTERQRLTALCVLIFFSVFFFGAFEQAGSSLTLFADRETNRMIFGWEMPASYFQVLNPLFIIMLAPLFSKMWIKLSERNQNPSAPFKFIWGLALLGLGFVVMIFAAKVYQTSGPVSIIWLCVVYMLHTWGELCLSPVGLSTVTKLAPAKFLSLMMGIWFFASGFGSGAAGFIAGNYDSMNHSLFYMIPTATALGGALILLLLSGKVKKWMHGVE